MGQSSLRVDSTAQGDSPARGLDWRRPWSSHIGSAILCTAIVLVGLSLRLVLSARMPVDSDEAILGLMGKHILIGERPVFLWGQNYVGAVEAYLVAVVFSLVGTSAFTLRIVPIAFSVGFCYLVYLLGSRLYDRRVGLLSALYVSIPPFLMTEWVVWAKGYHPETLFAGTALLLLLDDVAYRGRREIWRLVLWGLVAGIASFVGQTVLPCLIVTALFVIVRLGWRASRVVLVSGAAFVVGSAPLWLWNILNNFGTVEQILRMNAPGSGGLLHLPLNLARAATVSMPFFLGFLAPAGTSAQIAQVRRFDNLFYDLGLLATLGLAILGVHWLVTARRPWLRNLIDRRDAPLFAFMVIEIVLYALSPGSALQWGEPRYLLILFAATPFFMAYLVRLGERRRLAAAAILVAVMAVNLRSALPVLLRPEVAHPSPVVQYLIDRGFTKIWADFWVAYAVDFESDERITAATVAATPGKGLWIADNRYQPYLQTLLATSDSPFAFNDGSDRDTTFQKVLAEHGIQHNRVVVGGVAVYDSLRPPAPFTP